MIERLLCMSEETLRIMIATDLHYLSKKINDGGEAFANTIAKGDGKVMMYIEEIIEAFCDEVRKRRPDVLILLGDLSFNGEKISHIELSKKLEKIVETGISVYLIPGNHDINYERCFGFCDNEIYKVDSVNAEEFREIYAVCGYKQMDYFDKYSGSYASKLTDDLYLLMLDTNSYFSNYLCEESFDWLERVLEEISKKGANILAVSHQNLLEQNFMFTEGFMIKNAERIEEIYRKYNVKLNLSGHMHIQHIEKNIVSEIVTSSLAVSPNHFANIIYDGNSFEYWTECLNVDTVEDFVSISKQEFEGVGRRQLAKLFNTHTFENEDEADKNKMGRAFIKMNESYFAGEIFDAEGFEEGIRLWEEQPECFTSLYIKSILDSVFKEQNKFKIEL